MMIFAGLNQGPNSSLASVKGQLNPMFRLLSIYDEESPRTNSDKCRALIDSLKPDVYDEVLKIYHGKASPLYEAFCVELQSAEDFYLK
jgi:hypothetical protein